VNRRRLKLVIALGVTSLLALVGVAVATGGGHEVRERLSGYEEVPSVSTVANGEFVASISRHEDSIDYRLSYRDLESDVTQAHIHFGQSRVNGGISVWLCANNPPITTAPPGTDTCPVREGTVSGTIEPQDVVGPTGQGIAAGEFDELVAALRRGLTYANVHTVAQPGGTIRAQLRDGR
jgi:hypothetical protein